MKELNKYPAPPPPRPALSSLWPVTSLSAPFCSKAMCKAIVVQVQKQREELQPASVFLTHQRSLSRVGRPGVSTLLVCGKGDMITSRGWAGSFLNAGLVKHVQLQSLDQIRPIMGWQKQLSWVIGSCLLLSQATAHHPQGMRLRG